MSIESIERQIEDINANIELIEERISEYVESSDIPLQLVKEHRNAQARLDELRTELNQFPVELRKVAKEQPPIDLLLFMADREPQDHKMDELLAPMVNRFSRPVVCIVYGDQQQGHDKFLERLRHTSLPYLLGLDRNTSVMSKPVNWPYPLDDINKLPTRLRKNLSDVLCGHSRATDDEVQRRITTSPGPVLLHTLVDEQTWGHHGVQIVEHFLHFWRQWRAVPPHGLFICLCIKYHTEQKEAPASQGLWQRLWRRPKQTVAIDAEIGKALGQFDTNPFHPLICAILPKLDDIEKPQLENWARLEITQNYCKAKRLDIFPAIHILYETWHAETSSRAIPMDPLAERLRVLLA
jgi:hypothetical protein